MDVFHSLSQANGELLTYCNKLLNGITGNCKLYLLSNLSNSTISSYDNEIGLYVEVIRNTAETDTTVIIKNHPRGSDILTKKLVDILSSTHQVVLIDDKSFNFYPIELWISLISRCEIYPVFSTSVISLYYLFSKNVIMPLNGDLIAKYIYSDKIAHVSQGEDMCRQAIVALESWDGNSPIWKRKRIKK
jgi:hypothetical protein